MEKQKQKPSGTYNLRRKLRPPHIALIVVILAYAVYASAHLMRANEQGCSLKASVLKMFPARELVAVPFFEREYDRHITSLLTEEDGELELASDSLKEIAVDLIRIGDCLTLDEMLVLLDME